MTTCQHGRSRLPTGSLYHPSPGAGAAAFRKLADAGVNVDLLLPVRISDEEFYAVTCADDAAAAEEALGGQVVSA